MRALPWILVACLTGLLLWSWFRPISVDRADANADSVIIRDTIRDSFPYPVAEKPIKNERVKLPVHKPIEPDALPSVPVPDSSLTDSVEVEIPITQREYATDKYRVWISGYNPMLDSIHVFKETVYVKPKPFRRLGLTITAGYGFCKEGLSPAVIVGVSYRIW